jgi:hypothetical protein
LSSSEKKFVFFTEFVALLPPTDPARESRESKDSSKDSCNIVFTNVK